MVLHGKGGRPHSSPYRKGGGGPGQKKNKGGLGVQSHTGGRTLALARAGGGDTSEFLSPPPHRGCLVDIPILPITKTFPQVGLAGCGGRPWLEYHISVAGAWACKTRVSGEFVLMRRILVRHSNSSPSTTLSSPTTSSRPSCGAAWSTGVVLGTGKGRGSFRPSHFVSRSFFCSRRCAPVASRSGSGREAVLRCSTLFLPRGNTGLVQAQRRVDRSRSGVSDLFWSPRSTQTTRCTTFWVTLVFCERFANGESTHKIPKMERGLL